MPDGPIVDVAIGVVVSFGFTVAFAGVPQIGHVCPSRSIIVFV